MFPLASAATANQGLHCLLYLSVLSGNLRLLLFVFLCSLPRSLFCPCLAYKSREHIAEDTANIQGAVKSHVTSTCTTFGNKRSEWSRLCHLTFFWKVSWINLILRNTRTAGAQPLRTFWRFRPCATSINSTPLTKLYSAIPRLLYRRLSGFKGDSKQRPAGWSNNSCLSSSGCLETKKAKRNGSIATGIWSSPLADKYWPLSLMTRKSWSQLSEKSCFKPFLVHVMSS